jgi:hypothetical protein
VILKVLVYNSRVSIVEIRRSVGKVGWNAMVGIQCGLVEFKMPPTPSGSIAGQTLEQ